MAKVDFQPRIYFVTGVSGTGKSTIIPLLKSLLPADKYTVYDFDERGVPSSVDEKWRQDETRHWLETGQASAERGLVTVVCGLSQPDEAQKASSFLDLRVEFCLLDASDAAIKQRLEKRFSDKENVKKLKEVSGVTPEEFVEDNIKYARNLRDLCKTYHCNVVDTTALSPQEVAETVVSWIKKER